jgi:hypothetical protein
VEQHTAYPSFNPHEKPAIGPKPRALDPVASTEEYAWSRPVRVAFRFCFCYLLLYMLPAPGRLGILDAVPGGATLATPIVRIWQGIIPWVAQHLLHLATPAVATFSRAGADRTTSYVQITVIVALALIATLCWSIAARRSAYPRLNAVLRLFIRAFLFVGILPFGLNKIIPLQFPSPPVLSRLVQPLGTFTPAGLLWNFMGASTAYQMLSGFAETLAVCLLLFRRVTTLGALATTAVMLNVVALNYCYDLGVKLYSSHLLAMSCFLLVPDLQRLADMFILNRAVRIETGPPVPANSALRTGSKGVAIACICWFAVSTGAEYWRAYLKVRSWRDQDPLYGVYEVESFSRNGQEVPPLVTDTTRWRSAYTQSPTSFAFMRMDSSWDWYFAKFDNAAHMVLLERTNRREIGNLTYLRPDPAHVRLEGKLMGEPVSILLRSDPSKTRLMNDRFHWIHETPPSAQ